MHCFLWVAIHAVALWPATDLVRAQPVFAGLGLSGREIQLPSSDAAGRAPVVTAVRLQPGGNRMAAAGDDHRITVWDLAEDRLLFCLDGHLDWVHALAFSPDGRTLVSAGNDRQVIFWDVTDGRRLGVLQGTNWNIAQVAFSHQGHLLAVTGFECGVRIYDVAKRQLVRRLEGPCEDLRALAFSPDDRWIAAGGRSGAISIWQTADGKRDSQYTAHRQRVRDLAFSPDGERLVSCGEDRRIHVRSLGGGPSFDLPPCPGKVYALVFCSPKCLATGGSDNVVRLWDLTKATEVGQLNEHQGSVVTLASDGDVLVSGGYDTTIRVWDLKGRVAEAPRRTHERQ